MTLDEWANASAVVMAPLARSSLSNRRESWYAFRRVLDYRGAIDCEAESMATAEYYRKQVELLLVWAMAATRPDLKAKLLARALDFWRS